MYGKCYDYSNHHANITAHTRRNAPRVGCNDDVFVVFTEAPTACNPFFIINFISLDFTSDVKIQIDVQLMGNLVRTPILGSTTFEKYFLVKIKF